MARELDQRIDQTMTQLTEQLDALEAEEFDVELGEGKLVIDVEDGGPKFIVSRQGATNQIWLAEPGGGWRFDLVDDRWVCAKRGVELTANLAELLTAVLGRPVVLTDGA